MSLRLVVVGLILTTMMALGMIAWRLSAPPVQVIAQTQVHTQVKPLTETYLVAAHVLPAGTLTRATDITTRSAPVGKVPAGAILDTPFARASIEGALIRTYTDAGAAIVSANVLRPRDRGFLAAVLPPGMRAVSIPVDQVSGVAGLIWPGDHVDVMLTELFSGSKDNRVPAGHQVMTETVLYNARVIAVDQAIVQGAPPNAAVTGKVAHTVTLEVDARDAQRLNVAENLGRLSLAIRAVDTSAVPQAQPRGSVFASDVTPALAISAGGPSPGAGHNVEVIQGDQRTEVHFP
ncbi:MAG: Flp pilus assembly protein CpaB [Rhodospirillales bacterium]|nr:Flp pilus assembly protein CpaB [Rhodospirillales bacterium]